MVYTIDLFDWGSIDHCLRASQVFLRVSFYKLKFYLLALFRNFSFNSIFLFLLLFLDFLFLTFRLSKLAINFFVPYYVISIQVYHCLRLTYFFKSDETKPSFLLGVLVGKNERVHDSTESWKELLEFLKSNIVWKTSHKNFSRRFLILELSIFWLCELGSIRILKALFRTATLRSFVSALRTEKGVWWVMGRID